MKPQPERAARVGLIALAYVAFVSLGLPDAVLGVAWPSIAGNLGVQAAMLGAPLAAGACTYFASGLAAGRLVAALGIGGLLLLSTLLALAGVVGYALAPAFAWFLVAAAVVGFGSGGIDAALNTYAARHFGAHHMTWLHAAFSAGAAASPAIMTAVLARGASYSVGYAIVAAALAIVAGAFAFTRRAWGARDQASQNSGKDQPVAAPHSTWAALKSRAVQLQIATFFFYGGIEVGAGQWSYTVLTQARGVHAVTAGEWVTAYWGSLFVGRVLLGFVVRELGAARLLRVATMVALMATALFSVWTLPASLAALGLPLLGLSLAPIFPALMAETPRRVGHDMAAHAVGFQVSAATLGVAIVPNFAGLLAERFGLNAVAVFFVVCTAALSALQQALVALIDTRH